MDMFLPSVPVIAQSFGAALTTMLLAQLGIIAFIHG